MQSASTVRCCYAYESPATYRRVASRRLPPLRGYTLRLPCRKNPPVGRDLLTLALLFPSVSRGVRSDVSAT